MQSEFSPWYDPNYEAPDMYCDSEFNIALGDKASRHYTKNSAEDITNGR